MALDFGTSDSRLRWILILLPPLVLSFFTNLMTVGICGCPDPVDSIQILSHIPGPPSWMSQLKAREMLEHFVAQGVSHDFDAPNHLYVCNATILARGLFGLEFTGQSVGLPSYRFTTFANSTGGFQTSVFDGFR
jgi:hypothetical protein